MINNKKILAVVLARKNSKGLPGKNIKNLNGKPLVAWPISTAKKSKYIDKIILPHQSNSNPVFEIILINNSNVLENKNVSIYFHSIGENNLSVVEMFPWKRL